MEIGTFSKEMNVSIDTLRYYDKIGILVPNRLGTKRDYSLDDKHQIELIMKLKSCEFTLNEIKLIIKNAGKTLIQIIDDGKGMTEVDARMCFEKHATSKINSVEDLFAIHTMRLPFCLPEPALAPGA